jgi:hypothetical protein
MTSHESPAPPSTGSPFGPHPTLYRPDLDLAVIERAAEIATQQGVSTAQVALSWLLHEPGVTAPIVGATRLEHLEDALAAEQLALSDEEITRLEEPYVPIPCRGSSSSPHQVVAVLQNLGDRRPLVVGRRRRPIDGISIHRRTPR